MWAVNAADAYLSGVDGEALMGGGGGAVVVAPTGGGAMALASPRSRPRRRQSCFTITIASSFSSA